jgi:hypothetical protein
MLRENNSYCNYVRFIAGRESSLADKSIRMESNLALACTVGATVSDPQGYNYQYAISMPRNTGGNIASHPKGEGNMIISSQITYEEGVVTLNGVGSIVANMSTAETMNSTLSGLGNFNSTGVTKEVLLAVLDAGSRPSALDIAQEVWQSQLSNYNASGTMGGKLNEELKIEISEQDKIDLIDRMLNTDITEYQIENSWGRFVVDMKRILVNKATRSGNIITIYKPDGVIVWKRYDLSNGGRVEL